MNPTGPPDVEGIAKDRVVSTCESLGCWCLIHRPGYCVVK